MRYYINQGLTRLTVELGSAKWHFAMRQAKRKVLNTKQRNLVHF